MKILLLSQFFDPEPGAGRGLPFARWLTRRGHSVRVLTAVPNYPLGRAYPGYKMRPQQECMDGIPVRRIPLYATHNRSALHRSVSYMSFAAMAAAFLFKEPAPDVCYVLNLPTVAAAALAHRWIRGIPFVYNVPDLWPEAVRSSGMVNSSIMQRAMERAIHRVGKFVHDGASAITVISPGFKRLLVERGVPEEKIHVVYNWVDEELFQPSTASTSAHGIFRVLYAGNLGTFQGLSSVLDAADLLRDRRDIRVVFIGRGQEETKLKQKAAELNLPNVEFLPPVPVDKMPDVYATADALLVHLKPFSELQTWIPSKTQVSMALGKPIILGVEGDAGDLINASGAGFVCQSGDPASIADAILRMRSCSDEERKQMGERGRDYYLKQMSLEVGAARLEQILASAARKSLGAPYSAKASA